MVESGYEAIQKLWNTNFDDDWPDWREYFQVVLDKRLIVSCLEESKDIVKTKLDMSN